MVTDSPFFIDAISVLLRYIIVGTSTVTGLESRMIVNEAGVYKVTLAIVAQRFCSFASFSIVRFAILSVSLFNRYFNMLKITATITMMTHSGTEEK